MKIIKIEHERCDETEGFTFLVKPDSKLESDVVDDVNKAIEMYKKAKVDFAAATPPPQRVVWGFDASNYPEDMSIGEARRLHAEARKAADEYSSLKSNAGASFAQYMEQLGYMSLWNMCEPDCIEVTAYWGHDHGNTFNYSIVDPDEVKV